MLVTVEIFFKPSSISSLIALLILPQIIFIVYARRISDTICILERVMMRSLKIAISFMLLACMITGGVSKIFGDQACQPVTPEGHLQPPIPHLTLTEEYLNKFNEIIVIGDQHGCFDEEQLLIQRHMLNDTVLKIFTGDLTSKGNKNLEVVRFIKNCSSCTGVRGNNDEKTLLKAWLHYNRGIDFGKADKWIADLNMDDLEWLRSLPYSLYLPSMNARVCHGGFLPGGIPIEDNRPYTIMNIRTVIADPKCPGGWRPTREEFLWDSVKAPTFAWASQWRGPEHIYFGHDHKRQLQLYPFATGVDTACVRGHYMTGLFIKGPRKGTFATQPALKKYYHGKV